MEEVQDIVIVGAGIAGLTTSLGLHKYPSSLYFYLTYLFIVSCLLELHFLKMERS